MSVKRKAEAEQEQEQESKDKKAKAQSIDLTKEYSVEVKIMHSIGRYAFVHGYLHLTELPRSSCQNIADVRDRIVIKMSPDLLRDVKEIVLRNEFQTGLMWFSGPFDNNTIIIVPSVERPRHCKYFLDFNQKLSVPRSPDLASCDLLTLHSVEIQFPNTTILGDASVCSICLSDETPEVGERLVTQCGHLFHLSCMFSYFRHNGLVHLCSDCSFVRVKPFKCPVCKTSIRESW